VINFSRAIIHGVVKSRRRPTIGMVAAAGTNSVMRRHGYLSDVDEVSLDARLPDGVP